MIYDYNHYNDPVRGNKHIYAYGRMGESIRWCGFIEADNKTQAKATLNAHNKAWDDYDSVLLDYSETECRAEMERREAEQTRQNGSFKIIERRN